MTDEDKADSIAAIPSVWDDFIQAFRPILALYLRWFRAGLGKAAAHRPWPGLSGKPLKLSRESRPKEKENVHVSDDRPRRRLGRRPGPGRRSAACLPRCERDVRLENAR